jgi:hypothetical protein
MSPQNNIPTHSSPNSHQGQKTPVIRAVTPQTPHGMVRRSARQQYNLSQDMMAEAINFVAKTKRKIKTQHRKQ